MLIECPGCKEACEERDLLRQGWTFGQIGNFRVSVCSKECAAKVEAKELVSEDGEGEDDWQPL